MPARRQVPAQAVLTELIFSPTLLPNTSGRPLPRIGRAQRRVFDRNDLDA